MPGSWLRAVSLHLFGRPVAERFLFPVIADLQHEVRASTGDGRARRFATSARGYFAFWRTAAACGLRVREPALGSLFRPAGVMLASVLFLSLLEIAPIISVFGRGRWQGIGLRTTLELLALLLPQALVVTLPVGALFAGFLENRRRQASEPAVIARSLLAISLGAALLSLLMTVWTVPAANQAFREKAYRAAAIATGGNPYAAAPSLEKGPPEMTAGELLRARRLSEGNPRAQANFDWYRHQKAAVPVAALVFALVALAAGTRRAARWPMLRAAVLTAFVAAAYAALYISGRILTLNGVVPASAGAWGANVTIGAVALLTATWRLSRLRADVTTAS
jgi:lipopolysaccharide export LptBFGC system permease protein LptF